MSNPADELTQLKSRIELYEKELDDITQKITDLLNESTLTSNAEEVVKIYGIEILQYQKLVKTYREYIDSLERRYLIVDSWQTNQRYNKKDRTL